MLGLPLKYWLRNPIIAVKDIVGDPRGIWARADDFMDMQRELKRPHCTYQQDANWEIWMHEQIGASMPCRYTIEFWELWDTIMAELRALGIEPGPMSYGQWNDGDAGFVRAIWCLVRHLKPQNVVETG